MTLWRQVVALVSRLRDLRDRRRLEGEAEQELELHIELLTSQYVRAGIAQIVAGSVSADFFRLFGATTAAGRTFSADEDRPNGGRVAVLSNGFWQRRFGGAEEVVGGTLSLGGDAHTVLGVLAPFDTEAIQGPEGPPDVYLPFQIDPTSAMHGHWCCRLSGAPSTSAIGARPRPRLRCAACCRSTTCSTTRSDRQVRPTASQIASASDDPYVALRAVLEDLGVASHKHVSEGARCRDENAIRRVRRRRPRQRGRSDQHGYRHRG